MNLKLYETKQKHQPIIPLTDAYFIIFLILSSLQNPEQQLVLPYFVA